MAGVLLATEIVAVVLLLLVLLALGLVIARRRLIAPDNQLMLSSLRVHPDAPWRTGLLRLHETTLEWYPLFGLLPRKAHVWPRSGLDISTATEVPSPLNATTHRAVRMAFRASCTIDGFEDAALAVPADAYTGLRAWLESAPPTRG